MNKRKFNRLAGLDLLARHSKESLAPEQKTDIGIACRASMLAFKTGCATETHWNSLAFCLNVAMALTEIKVMPEGLSAIEGGQDALEIVRDIGKLQLGSHAFVINSAVNIFLKQLEVASKYQVELAITEVLKRNEQTNLVAEDKIHCT